MPRETFVDPAGNRFTIDTDLLASDGNARARFDDRALGRKSIRRASTRSSRYGELPGGEIAINDFEHGELHLCAHGQNARRCSSCGTWFCPCPGTLPHECRGAA